MSGYRYTVKEIGELNAEIDRLRTENERLGNIINSASDDYDRIFADLEAELHVTSELSGEIARLRADKAELVAALDQIVDVIAGSKSGFIAGSQADCEWDQKKDAALKARAAIARATENVEQ
jgi:hypothetical protein